MAMGPGGTKIPHALLHIKLPPLSCLGSSVVEHRPSKQYICRGFESHLSSSFLHFCENTVVQVSGVALFIYVLCWNKVL